MTQGVSEKDTYIYRFIVFFPPGRMKNMHKVYIKWGGTGYKSFTVVQDAGARWMDFHWYFHFDGDENYRNYQLSNAIPFLQMFLSTKEIGNQLPEFPLVSFLETQCPMNKWIHSSRFQMEGEKFFSLKRYGYSMARLNLSHTLREVFFRGKWINVFLRIDVTIVFPLSFFFFLTIRGN